MSTNEIVEEIVHFFIQWILVETNRSYFEQNEKTLTIGENV